MTAPRTARSSSGGTAGEALPILSFESAGALREWLTHNHTTSPGILVRIYSKRSDTASVSFEEVLDEGLCFGWSESTRHRGDEPGSYLQRFTPRRAVGTTSARNRAHAARLINEGRMTPAGLVALGDSLAGSWLAASDGEGARAASARRHEVTSLARVNAPTLETARLRLRPWQPDDLAWYVALRADPEVSRFLGDGRPQPHDAASADFEWASAEWARVGVGPWAVEERSTGMRVGYCGLPLWREGTPDEAVEIGCGYARDAWGKGYATEAAAAAMRWAFEARGLDSLVALTSPENRASQHVLGKLGFTRDGDAEGQHGRGAFFRVTRAAFEASPASEATRAASD